MVKIAYVLPNIESGGTERHILSLARSLDRSRYSLSLATTAGGGSLYEEFSAIMPVTVMGDPHAHRRIKVGPLTHIGTIRALMRIYRQERPDIVHAYLPAACVIGPIAARLAGVGKVIISRRALSNYKAKYPLLHRIEPLGYKLANAVLVNSDAVRRDVERTERFWEGKIRRIYNGIDIAPQDPAPIGRLFPELAGDEEAPVIAYVANLFPYKGHRDLVDAARTVADEFPSVRFLLVGRDAGEMDAVRARIAAGGLERHVLLTGLRSDALKIAAASSFVVHPSHEEGFSNTILEAMAAGKAVVATRVGGNPEAVVDGDTGILVPPGDPGPLAEAMLALLRDPARAQAMGEAGRRRVVERFSLEKMVREIASLYEDLHAGADLRERAEVASSPASRIS
ncbi:MAG: glycosyltransferase [Deltaproteobacteria bacterium]|nr:glycosyltransferase [Deltaproteobacteria bacterium]